MGRLSPFVLLAAALLVGASIFSALEAPSGIPETPPVTLGSPPLPEAFSVWPPLVVSWSVSGPAAESSSILDPGFWSNPCRTLGSEGCQVRLAWERLGWWSVVVSRDTVFHEGDGHRISLGTLYYGVENGVVVDVRDSPLVTSLEICDDLLSASVVDPAITVSRSPASLSVAPDWEAVDFEAPRGRTARCLGPSGIPVAFSSAGHSWSLLRLELRSPTEDELGIPLVAARALDPPTVGCRVPEESFGALPAGRWLLEVAEAAGSYRLSPTPVGVELRNPPRTGAGSVLAWVTGPHTVLRGGRLRRIDSGVVGQEVVEPAPVLTVDLGVVRLWASLTDDVPPSRVPLERGSSQLRWVVRDLVAASDQLPYEGPPPDC